MHAALLILLSSVAATSENWPGFLGAGTTAPAADSLPLEWSPEQNIAWQAQPPGFGQSSPVIWDGRVFVTSIAGPMKETCHVTAYGLKDGQELWRHDLAASDEVKNTLYVSRAAPTPVVDGQAVYAYFESGDIAAISHDGQQLWHRSLSKEHGRFQNKFGLAASPVQTDDTVILLVDDEGPSYLLALEKKDGTTRWKTDRRSRVSWTSPSLVPVAGEPQVVVSSAGSVDGYDPQTGKLLWSYTDVGGNTTVTPLPFADGKFLVGASPGQDGENTEGAKKSNLAMSIEMVDGQPTPKVLWRTEQATPSFCSPMVHAGHAYWVNRVGVVFCFDVETGELKYNRRLKQSCWATPLGTGDRVYFFGKDGLTTVLQAGPEFKVLAENQLWDPDQVQVDQQLVEQEEDEGRRRAATMFAGPVQYGIAAVDGSLLIRTGERLYCLRKE